jgi:hypothetical protein
MEQYLWLALSLTFYGACIMAGLLLLRRGLVLCQTIGAKIRRHRENKKIYKRYQRNRPQAVYRDVNYTRGENGDG